MSLFDKDEILQSLKQGCTQNKLEWDEIKDKIRLIVYTDGGSASENKYAGSGMHGYFYVDEKTNSNSSSPKGYATNKGYSLQRPDDNIYKVPVLSYVDFYKGLPDATNNYAELYAGLSAINLANSYPVEYFELISDSKYLLQGIDEWMHNWKSNNWVSKNGSVIANVDMWKVIYDKWITIKDKSKLTWVKGHDGNVGNEYADRYATCGIHMQKNPNYDGSASFYIAEPKEFWDRSHELPALFSEKRFLLHRDGNDKPFYFQFSMGKLWPNNEEERRICIGKRIADTCVSAVLLKQDEPVLELLSKYCRDIGDMDSLVCGRLDLLTKGTLYNEIKNSNAFTLNPKGDVIQTPAGVELMAELKPGRLSWRMGTQLEWLAELLVSFVNFDEQKDIFRYVDITTSIYDISVNKKDKKVYSLRDDVQTNNIVTHSFSIDDMYANIELTLDVDLPSKTDLKRIGNSNPKVSLLYWRDYDKDNLVYYACVFEADGNYALYTSAYSNFFIIKSKD